MDKNGLIYKFYITDNYEIFLKNPIHCRQKSPILFNKYIDIFTKTRNKNYGVTSKLWDDIFYT
jgi:hypothetical protein